MEGKRMHWLMGTVWISCVAFVCVCAGQVEASMEGGQEGRSGTEMPQGEWERWLDGELGTITSERADLLLQALALLEREKKAVSEGWVKDLDLINFDVASDDGLNGVLNALVEKFGDFKYGTCEATYGKTTPGNPLFNVTRIPSAGVVKITINSEMSDKQELVWRILKRAMATLRYEDVLLESPGWLTRNKFSAWLEASIACSGFAVDFLPFVRASGNGDGKARKLFRLDSFSEVELSWLHCAVCLFRGEEPVAPMGLSPAAQRAFEIGMALARANLMRMKAILASKDPPAWKDAYPKRDTSLDEANEEEEKDEDEASSEKEGEGGTGAEEEEFPKEGWNVWLDKKLGRATRRRADAAARILSVIEKKRKALSQGRVEGIDLEKFEVKNGDDMNDFLNALAEKFGDFRYATCEARYGEGEFVTSVGRIATVGQLKITVNRSKTRNDAEVRAILARTMAGLRYEDVQEEVRLNKLEESMWGDVCAACTGIGASLLTSVTAKCETDEEGDMFNLAYFAMHSPVETAWLYCTVELLRGQTPTEPKDLSPAGRRAYEIGLFQARLNLERMKALLASRVPPAWNGALPETPPDPPRPRRKIKRKSPRRPMMKAPMEAQVEAAVEDLKPKVSSLIRKKGGDGAAVCRELAEREKVTSVNRFALLSESLRLLVVKGRLDEAIEMFETELEKHGAEYAIALVGSVQKGRRSLSKDSSVGSELANWMAEVDEMKEACRFLAKNEDELEYIDAASFLREKAAQCYMTLHDEKNAYEELYRTEANARRVLWNMGFRLSKKKAQPKVSTAEIADFWWNFGDGKDSGVVAFCGRLSDEWYEKALEDPAVKKTEEWRTAARQRIGKWKSRMADVVDGFKGELSSRLEPAGNSGLMVKSIKGGRPTTIPPLSTLVKTSTTGKKKVVMNLYDPRNFWLHRAWVAGWRDAFGNEITLYRVRNMPLKSSDYGDEPGKRPTKACLEKDLDATSVRFLKAGKADVLDWLAGVLERGRKTLNVVPTGAGMLRSAHLVLGGKDRLEGALLITPKGELYFARMKIPTLSSREAIDFAKNFIRSSEALKFTAENIKHPIVLPDGWTLYPVPGYLIRTDQPESTAKELVTAIVDQMTELQKTFQEFIPPQGEMGISTLRIFAHGKGYYEYLKDELDKYDERSIGMWVGWREELLLRGDWSSRAQNARKEIMASGRREDNSVLLETLSTVRHEGFHQYLYYATGRNGHALWFNEGHACLFETGGFKLGVGRRKPRFEICDDPTLRRPRDVDAEPEKIANLIPKVLQMDHDAFMSGTLAEVNRRYAASWAVVYFLRRAVPVLPEFKVYENVVPTYLSLMRKDTMTPEEATRRAWTTVGERDIAADFLRFWRSSSMRQAARARGPSTDPR